MIMRFFVILFFSTGCFAASPLRLPDDMHEWALESISCVYRQEFKAAEVEARKIIRKYPDHPAGFFFLAAVIDSRMEYARTEKQEVEFFNTCDIAIAKGEKFLERDPDDVWAKFFTAGAYGIKGTHESRYDRWITAFRLGWEGVVMMREISQTHPDLRDAFLGIGTYDYWRSAMTKMLWWMPGVEDKRKPAMALIAEVCTTSTYVQETASKQLIAIYNNESRFADARTMADMLLRRYPQSRFFLWGRIEASIGLGAYDVALTDCLNLLKKIFSEPIEGSENELVCRFFLAKTYLGQKKYVQVLSECNKVLEMPVNEADKKRLGKYLNQTLEIKKMAQSQTSSSKR